MQILIPPQTRGLLQGTTIPKFVDPLPVAGDTCFERNPIYTGQNSCVRAAQEMSNSRKPDKENRM